MVKMTQENTVEDNCYMAGRIRETFKIPFIGPTLQKCNFAAFIPFLPSYDDTHCCILCRRYNKPEIDTSSQAKSCV